MLKPSVRIHFLLLTHHDGGTESWPSTWALNCIPWSHLCLRKHLTLLAMPFPCTWSVSPSVCQVIPINKETRSGICPYQKGKSRFLQWLHHSCLLFTAKLANGYLHTVLPLPLIAPCNLLYFSRNLKNTEKELGSYLHVCILNELKGYTQYPPQRLLLWWGQQDGTMGTWDSNFSTQYSLLWLLPPPLNRTTVKVINKKPLCLQIQRTSLCPHLPQPLRMCLSWLLPLWHASLGFRDTRIHSHLVFCSHLAGTFSSFA